MERAWAATPAADRRHPASSRAARSCGPAELHVAQPVDLGLETGLERRPRLEPEDFLGAGDIADRTVAIRRCAIELDVAIRRAEPHDKPRDVPRRPALACGDVECSLSALFDGAQKRPRHVADIDGI